MRCGALSLRPLIVCCLGCGPETQPLVRITLSGVTAAAAANGVASAELEVQAFFRPEQPTATAFNGERRRIVAWDRVDPSSFTFQIPQATYTATRVEVRVARLCAGATVGYQVIAEGTNAVRFSAMLDRSIGMTIAVASVARSTDCSAR